MDPGAEHLSRADHIATALSHARLINLYKLAACLEVVDVTTTEQHKVALQDDPKI
jgi:hypothetical protein